MPTSTPNSPPSPLRITRSASFSHGQSYAAYRQTRRQAAAAAQSQGQSQGHGHAAAAAAPNAAKRQKPLMRRSPSLPIKTTTSTSTTSTTALSPKEDEEAKGMRESHSSLFWVLGLEDRSTQNTPMNKQPAQLNTPTHNDSTASSHSPVPPLSPVLAADDIIAAVSSAASQEAESVPIPHKSSTNEKTNTPPPSLSSQAQDLHLENNQQTLPNCCEILSVQLESKSLLPELSPPLDPIVNSASTQVVSPPSSPDNQEELCGSQLVSESQTQPSLEILQPSQPMAADHLSSSPQRFIERQDHLLRRSVHSSDDISIAHSRSSVSSRRRSRSPNLRPILKKSTSTPLFSTLNSTGSSLVSSAMPSPTSSVSSRLSFHTSRSAPNLSVTPNWDPDYRGIGRRDSVKSLCFDNVIKQVCLFSSDESPARIAQSPRYPESSDEFSSTESDIEEILGNIGDDYSFFADYNTFGEPQKQTTKIYDPWAIRSRSQRFPSQIAPIVSLDSIRLSNTSGTTIISPNASPGNLSSSYGHQPNLPAQKLTASILVKNLAYMKRVTARFTTDGWKTYHDAPAEFVSIVMPNTGPNPGLDRFSVQIDVEQHWLAANPPSERSPHHSPDMNITSSPSNTDSSSIHQEEIEYQRLCFEFAICGEMNGETYWDNNLGRNHELLLTRSVRTLPLMSAATIALMKASKGTLTTPEAVIEAAAAAAMRNAEVMAEEAEAIKKDFEMKQQQQQQQQQQGFFGFNRRGSNASAESLFSSGSISPGETMFRKVNSEVTLVGESSCDEIDGGISGGLRNTPKVSRHAKFTLSNGTVPLPGVYSSGFFATTAAAAGGGSIGSLTALNSHYNGSPGSTPQVRRRSDQFFGGGLYSLSADSFFEDADDQEYTMTSMPPSESGFEREWALASASSSSGVGSPPSLLANRGRSSTVGDFDTPVTSAPETRASSVTSLPSLCSQQPVIEKGNQALYHHMQQHQPKTTPQYQNDDTLYMRPTPPSVNSPASMASTFSTASKYSLGSFEAASMASSIVGMPPFQQQQHHQHHYHYQQHQQQQQPQVVFNSSSTDFMDASQPILGKNYSSRDSWGSAPPSLASGSSGSYNGSIGSVSNSSGGISSSERKHSVRRRSKANDTSPKRQYHYHHHHRLNNNNTDLADILGGKETKPCDSIDDLIEKKVMKSLDGWSVWDSVDEGVGVTGAGKDTDYGDDEGGY